VETFSEASDVDSEPAIGHHAQDAAIAPIEAQNSTLIAIEVSSLDDDSERAVILEAQQDETMSGEDATETDQIHIADTADIAETIDETVADVVDENAADTAAVMPPAPQQRLVRRRAGQTTPSFARSHAQATPTTPGRAWPAIAAIVALSGLLSVQILLADRSRLAADARWRPLLEAICGVLRCDLPAWREPTAFALDQRDVRQHPSVPGVLRVSASFRNEARWPQPWPTLRLTLSDVNGRTAGERRFQAREYLGGAPAQSTLASGETATVAMDVVEPAAQIVAYDFQFD
jgi:hypothetical protein